jgi:hypothetical protein
MNGYPYMLTPRCKHYEVSLDIYILGKMYVSSSKLTLVEEWAVSTT